MTHGINGLENQTIWFWVNWSFSSFEIIKLLPPDRCAVNQLVAGSNPARGANNSIV